MAKRRGRGEGSIYQRKDGRWCAEVFAGMVNGKPKRKVVYGATRKEVNEKLKVLLRDQQLGYNIAPERTTVAQFLNIWLEQVVKLRNRPRTYDSYAHTVQRHINPYLGDQVLSKLTALHVQGMLNELRATGLTRTVVYARNVLIIALNVAVRWNLVPRNVAALALPPIHEPRDIQPLDKNQALALLDAVKGHRLEVLYRIALMLGLRRGEVLALRWEDVDFDKATIRVGASLQRQHGQLERAPTKTKASNRLLPLPAILVQALVSHRERQSFERKVPNWQDHGLVFPTSRGTPIEPGSLNRHFRSALKRAGLPRGTRFHDLRHSAATLMHLQGVPLKVISAILGHSQIRTTADTYTHVLPEMERDAADRMDDLFGSTEDENTPPHQPDSTEDTEEPEEPEDASGDDNTNDE